MIKNFEERKKQLKELSSVINSFNSEAVQLKIIELIFDVEAPDDTDEDGQDERPPREARAGRRKGARKAAKKKASKKAASKKGAKKATSGTGGMSMLSSLVDEGYFSKRRSLNQIIDHCSSNKARNFKPSQFSGPLGRLVRDGRLKREKNTDNQYEYWK